MIDVKNTVWTEKYRPKKVKDVVGEFTGKIEKYLENPESMQHLLLYSQTPGTGKSSLAKAIIDELGADALFLNSSDDRKIETVREKINAFVKTKSSKDGMRRIVFLDEADGLTNIAQDALRNLMETYVDNALFILTCNRLNSIIEALQSRCQLIQFNRPDKKKIYEYLENICKNEKLKYTEAGLNRVIDLNYPSIRNCVQVLQSMHVEGKDITEDDAKSSDEIYQSLWTTITKDKDWKKVKEYVFTNDVDIRNLNKFFWIKAVEDSNVRMMQITAANEDKFTRGGEFLIIFITSLIDMVK